MTRFGWLDYTLFFAYLAASVLIGVLFVKEQKNVKDYFLAGRSMGYVTVAISVLAALFSGISYLGAPAEVYAHGMAFILFLLFVTKKRPPKGSPIQENQKRRNSVYVPFYFNFYPSMQAY